MTLRANKKAIENNIAKVTDAEIKASYIKDMTPSKEDLQHKAQLNKYGAYIEKKLETWQSEFLLSMKEKLQNKDTLTPNMEAALDKMMARDAEYEAKKSGKSQEPTRQITCKMKQWWCKEHNIDSRVITGMILAESAKAYLVKGYADMTTGTYCMRCGRELTEPASMLIGFGAECCEHLGIPYPSDVKTTSKKERMAIRQQLIKVLHNQVFEAWVPKSQISEVIEIVDVKPEVKPAKAKASKKAATK